MCFALHCFKVFDFPVSWFGFVLLFNLIFTLLFYVLEKYKVYEKGFLVLSSVLLLQKTSMVVCSKMCTPRLQPHPGCKCFFTRKTIVFKAFTFPFHRG